MISRAWRRRVSGIEVGCGNVALNIQSPTASDWWNGFVLRDFHGSAVFPLFLRDRLVFLDCWLKHSTLLSLPAVQGKGFQGSGSGAFWRSFPSVELRSGVSQQGVLWLVKPGSQPDVRQSSLHCYARRTSQLASQMWDKPVDASSAGWTLGTLEIDSI